MVLPLEKQSVDFELSFDTTDCQGADHCHTEHTTAFPRSSQGSSQPRWLTSEQLEAMYRRSAELGGVWLPITQYDSTPHMPPQMSHISFAGQSLAPSRPAPSLPDASCSPTANHQLNHSVPTSVNSAQRALDDAPFLDMADRFKLIQVADHQSANEIADGLSYLIESGEINAFSQLAVHGAQVFTVDCR